MSALAAWLGFAACAGWGVALVLALSLRRRLSLVADADHELRGAAAAIGLGAERLARTGATVAFRSLVRMQLDRMDAGLHDLAVARAPRRKARAAAAGDQGMDAGRLAQVLGNLIANATEHGDGAVDVSTSRPDGAVRIEIKNRNRPRELEDAGARRPEGRGRGLAIAERAARELGGRLSVEAGEGETRAALELPVGEGAWPDASASGAGTAGSAAGTWPDSSASGAGAAGANAPGAGSRPSPPSPPFRAA